MARLVLLFLLAASAVGDLEGQMSDFRNDDPSERRCGPSFCFDRQTANCFQKLPAEVCMKAVYMCVRYMFTDTTSQEFCEKERKSGNSAVIDALAASDSETEKMQPLPLLEAIWLMSLILFGVGIIVKHVLAQQKKEIAGQMSDFRNDDPSERRYMFTDTTSQEFCEKERKSGNSAVIDALAASDSETEKMQPLPLLEAIWLMSLILFGVGIIVKHVLAQQKKEIAGLNMPLLCDVV
ncbi:unnamed protein product [Symbiodinium sp. CCMP2592]|nr:unnamed protein product [Symbiodinium sp. CCMP2592]